MATEAPLWIDGAQTTAAANLYNPGTPLLGPQGSGQFLAVTLVGSRSVNIANAATWTPPASGFYGILQNTPTLGAPAAVALPMSIAKAVVAGAVTAGQLLMINAADGRLTPFVAGANNWAVAMAIESAAAANDVIVVQVLPPTRGLT